MLRKEGKTDERKGENRDRREHRTGRGMERERERGKKKHAERQTIMKSTINEEHNTTTNRGTDKKCTL